ncbi:hypothetical protein MKZ38_005687 [Zalerion maritima]|uniref:BZIP domain-containing protein n=1 Tax=Zalerion maritima TaxID=339359 RepID=A0AAD5RK56_9PEZI|nr:hypothetical protein MKZ38_005687 [Zalerion maritima]
MTYFWIRLPVMLRKGNEHNSDWPTSKSALRGPVEASNSYRGFYAFLPLPSDFGILALFPKLIADTASVANVMTQKEAMSPPLVSSRSVSLLSPEQRERKRAFDRMNQRACRARAKARIGELEEEVGELKGQLAKANEEISRLQSREDRFRQTIQTAHSSVPGIEGVGEVGAYHIPSAGHVASPMSTGAIAVSTPRSTQTPSFDAGTIISDGSMPHGGAKAFPENLALKTVSGDSLEPRVKFPMEQIDIFGIMNAGKEFPWDDFSFSIPFQPPTAGDDMGTSSPHSSPGMDGDFNSFYGINVPPSKPKPAKWSIVPLNTAPTSRLDKVIAELSRTAPSEQQNTYPASPSKFPSIGSLLNPSIEPTNTDLISQGVGKHGGWMSIPALPEKMAIMYTICLYIAWLREPTQATWLAMPPFLRPTKLQQTVPHPAWIDTVIWPKARDVIIEQMDWDQFDVFRAASGSGVSVNWPLSHRQVLAMGENEIALTPLFEAHIRDINSWTAGTETRTLFPFLAFLPDRLK